MAATLRRRRVLIAGGASGIGRACAGLLAREGANVAIFDVDRVAAELVALAIGCPHFVLDVSHETYVEAVVQALCRWRTVAAGTR